METLPHVLWIGGAPGSGKTTIATRLARRHGLRWYNADAHTWEHRDRALREGHAAAHRWEAMTPHERWVGTTPTEMLDLSLSLERWPMIADDLRGLPSSPLVVAEGSTILPELITAGVADRSRSVWLVPTPEVQRARLDGRHDVPAGDVEATRARHNMKELWLLVGAEIERRVRDSNVTVLDVGGSETGDEMLGAVERVFADAIAAGPRAETPAERRALLRYANEAIVSQCLQYLARPWSTGDAESLIRAFLCECGDPECTEGVEIAVAAFRRTAEPVVAPAHSAA